MQPDFWHERWMLQQIGFHQEAINSHLMTFWPALGVEAGQQVFVPLCGKSADMLWLRSQGYDVVGVELSPLAVRAFFEENALEFTVRQQADFEVYEGDGLRLYCGDFFQLGPADLGDLHAVYDRASLVALPPDMRTAYVAHMAKLLPGGARTLLVTFDYPQHEMSGPPFSVQDEEVRRLYANACEVNLVLDMDILPHEPRFRDRGVTWLHEKVYVLTYNPAIIKKAP